MTPPTRITWPPSARGGLGSRWPGIALAVGLHAVLVIALLSHAPARQTLAELAPIMVSLVQPQAAEPPKAPPQPKPVVRPPVKRAAPEPLPLLTTTVPETPAPAVIQPPPAPPPPSEPIAAKPAPAPVTPPQFNAGYLNNPAPVYPAVSRRLGEEGRVVLRVFVDERGLPAQVELRTSSGHERLDGIALQTVRQWKFVPARRGDQAVSAWVLVPISFSLRS